MGVVPPIGWIGRSNLNLGMMAARIMPMPAGRGFLRKAAASDFHERHVTDVAGIIPGIVMHLSIGTTRTASYCQNVVLDNARRANVKRRVREALPLARLLQIPTVVIVGQPKVPSRCRAAAATLKAVALAAATVCIMVRAMMRVVVVSCLSRGRDESE